MALEIERKFLVTGEFREHATKPTRIVQGYLSSVPERTVRVRIKGDQGFLTIKGIGRRTGASRYEWEREIPLAAEGHNRAYPVQPALRERDAGSHRL